MVRVRRWIIIALVLALPSCSSSSASTPVPVSPDCFGSPPARILDSGWYFRTDPKGVGVKQGWFLESFGGVGWTELSPGEPWELSGIEYDGVAWYRSDITLPDWSTVYLGFGSVDDSATLWVNREEVGTWDSLGREAVIIDMLAFGDPGDQISLALRVEDLGGYGGIKQPLRIGEVPRAVMTEAQRVTLMASTNPSWPMPAWSEGRPFAWTMTGRSGDADEALLSSHGAVAPWAAAPTVEVWIYDHSTGLLASGDKDTIRFWLTNDRLPIPQWEWRDFGTYVRNVLFGDIDGSGIHWHVEVHNDTDTEREISVVVIVRPFAIKEGFSPICTIGIDEDGSLWMNGDPFMKSDIPVDHAGVGMLEETMEAVLEGRAPSNTTISSAPAGNAAAVFVYPLELRPDEVAEMQLSFPGSPGEPLPGSFPDDDNGLAAAVFDWEQATGRVTLELPDDLVAQGTQASVGYLLLALDPDGPHPGPLAHDALWVRDASYASLALLQFGHADAVRSTIATVLDAQKPNGQIPPILGENSPWDDYEWDSQGQAIFLVTSYYRYTGDLEHLREWYPELRAAANFIALLRDSTASVDGPEKGLLPPSKSAEDLGPPNWHHYWDDFWALAGLEETAYAARILGESDDAAQIQSEAVELRAAIMASIESVMGREPSYIPGAVENLDGSAMARGTVPALWPVEVLSRDLPLLSRSFQHYHDMWVDPDTGGFRHVQGQFWPYGGLELAHAYLRLGRLDVLHQILGWTLDHQTMPGTFAWAEQVDPSHGGFSGGDMPHVWAAADYATLVREMLITEHGGALELFNGVPDWWLSHGKVILLENAPTHFGTLTLLQTESTLDQDGEAWNGDLQISLDGASSQRGFRWRLPQVPAIVDGPPGTAVDSGWLVIPNTGGTVRLTFSSRE